MKTTLLKMASVSLLAATTFCACSKDKDENGSDNGSLKQITIKIDLNYVDSIELAFYQDSKNVVLSSASYADGKCTLNLPASVDDKYLRTIEDSKEESVDKGFPGATVSKPNLKRVNVFLSGISAGRNVCGLYHGTEEWNSYLMYVNEDVTMTGTTEDDMTAKYSIDAKKGWNIIYWSDKINPAEMTTKVPADAVWRQRD